MRVRRGDRGQAGKVLGGGVAGLGCDCVYEVSLAHGPVVFMKRRFDADASRCVGGKRPAGTLSWPV